MMGKYDSVFTERANLVALDGFAVESFGDVEWFGHYDLVDMGEDGWSVIHEDSNGFIYGENGMDEDKARELFDGIYAEYCRLSDLSESEV